MRIADFAGAASMIQVCDLRVGDRIMQGRKVRRVKSIEAAGHYDRTRVIIELDNGDRARWDVIGWVELA